jgi:hypothetical protein
LQRLKHFDLDALRFQTMRIELGAVALQVGPHLVYECNVIFD